MRLDALLFAAVLLLIPPGKAVDVPERGGPPIRLVPERLQRDPLTPALSARATLRLAEEREGWLACCEVESDGSFVRLSVSGRF